MTIFIFIMLTCKYSLWQIDTFIHMAKAAGIFTPVKWASKSFDNCNSRGFWWIDLKKSLNIRQIGFYLSAFPNVPLKVLTGHN